MPSSGDFYQSTGSVTLTDSSTGIGYSTQLAGTSAGTTYSSRPMDSYSAMKKESPAKAPVRRKIVVRVINSPKGHRVKLVGANLVELASLFVRWADRLEKDLRVVATDGEAAYQFYGRPMVAERVGQNGLCLFLTGSMKSELKDGDAKWRVGLDEMLALKAPAKLDSPEFPSFANILDEKKLFIGRVEGKMIYTMLYVPQRRIEKPDATLPGGLEMGEAHSYEPDPAALEPFAEHVLASYEKLMKTHAVEVCGGLTEVSFREFCGDSKRKRQRTLQETIDKANREIREIEASLTRKAREMREAQKDLALTMSGAVDKEMGEQARKLGGLVDKGLYTSFKIRHGHLVGMTAPIVIEHEGKQFDLGCFMVGIKKDGSLKIEHESKTHPYHPHISAGGGLCMGSFRNEVPKLIGLERYAMVYQVLCEFLGSYNAKDKYNKIEVCAGLEAAPTMAADGAQAPAVAATPGGAAPIAQTQNEEMNRIIRENDAEIRRTIGIPADQMNAIYRAQPQHPPIENINVNFTVTDGVDEPRQEATVATTLAPNETQGEGF